MYLPKTFVCFSKSLLCSRPHLVQRGNSHQDFTCDVRSFPNFYPIRGNPHGKKWGTCLGCHFAWGLYLCPLLFFQVKVLLPKELGNILCYQVLLAVTNTGGFCHKTIASILAFAVFIYRMVGVGMGGGGGSSTV